MVNIILFEELPSIVQNFKEYEGYPGAYINTLTLLHRQTG